MEESDRSQVISRDLAIFLLRYSLDATPPRVGSFYEGAIVSATTLEARACGGSRLSTSWSESREAL